jgi:hypothetical protein
MVRRRDLSKRHQNGGVYTHYAAPRAVRGNRAAAPSYPMARGGQPRAQTPLDGDPSLTNNYGNYWETTNFQAPDAPNPAPAHTLVPDTVETPPELVHRVALL